MVKVIKWLYRDNQTRNSGSVNEMWDGHISADHVHVGARHNVPHFAKGPAVRAEGVIDVVLYGCRVPTIKPRLPQLGETLTVSGYPAGSATLEHRHASVHWHRKARDSNSEYSVPTWVGKIDTPHPPYPYDSTHFDAVYGGMSGGLVSAVDGEPLGILVTQNGLADLNNDGITDDSFDFVALADVWEVFNESPAVA